VLPLALNALSEAQLVKLALLHLPDKRDARRGHRKAG